MKMKKERLKEKECFMIGTYGSFIKINVLIHFIEIFCSIKHMVKILLQHNSALSSHSVVTEHVQGCDNFEYICLQFVLEYFCS